MLEAINNGVYTNEQCEAVWKESSMSAEFPNGQECKITGHRALPVAMVNRKGERFSIGNGRPQRFVTTDLGGVTTNTDGHDVYDHIILMTRFTRQYTISVLDEEATAKARQSADEANSKAIEEGKAAPYSLAEIAKLAIKKDVKLPLFDGQKPFKAIIDDVEAKERGTFTEDEYPAGATIAAGHKRLATWLQGKTIISIYDTNNGLGYDVVDRYATKSSERVSHYNAVQYFMLSE